LRIKFLLILLLLIFLSDVVIGASWNNIEDWDGTITHSNLNINLSCTVEGSNIECTACKSGFLQEYKWEIMLDDGTGLGSTGWLDYENVNMIFIQSFEQENTFKIVICGKNDYNETTENYTSIKTEYTIPILPPEEPDPTKQPNKPFDINSLPEAGEYKEDSTNIFGIEIHNYLIIFPVLIFILLFCRASIKWKKVKRRPVMWMKDKKPIRKRLPDGRTLIINRKAKRTKVWKTKKLLNGKKLVIRIKRKFKPIKRN